MSTDLYKRTIAFNYDDTDRKALMRKVWDPTPFMVDAWTGRHEDGRDRQMIEWCFTTFGPESSPIHGKAGRWHRGGATVNGWTWFGFSTDTELQQFLERWPTPAEAGLFLQA